jgi:RNA polymerase sigma-70 factor, ECF subfamily
MDELTQLLHAAQAGDRPAQAGFIRRTQPDRLLQHLDLDRRTAFVLTQLLGLSYSQAAEVCGCPVGTIRSRVAPARTDLLDWLGGPEARVSEQSAMREP